MMASSPEKQRIIAIAVDGSQYGEEAVDCKYKPGGCNNLLSFMSIWVAFKLQHLQMQA